MALWTNPIGMFIRAVFGHMVLRVAGFDAGVQRLVDAGSFALQRRGVARSSQLAGLHMVMCGTSAAVTPAGFQKSAAFGFLILFAALFWFAMGAVVYLKERWREQLVGGVPDRPTSWAGTRAIAWSLLLMEVVKWPALDALHAFAMLAFVVLAYLFSTPRKPPPAQRKASPSLVTVPA